MEHKTFVISDLHFGHSNIISYCKRPFSNVSHMDREMTRRWNDTVGIYDTTYVVGDFAKSNIGSHIKRLNGNKIFIKGNHDNHLANAFPFHILNTGSEYVLLIHCDDPNYYLNRNETTRGILRRWGSWIIHGHYHNNQMTTHPLINKPHRKINVSAELLNYTPIELNVLLKRRGVFT